MSGRAFGRLLYSCDGCGAKTHWWDLSVDAEGLERFCPECTASIGPDVLTGERGLV